MTRETKMLKEPRTLLDSKFSTSLDLQLICQVELWSTSAQVFDNFGAATDCAIVFEELSELDYFDDAYEHWRCEWTVMLETHLDVESPIPAFLDLYYHSARLYLSSHNFRGPAQGFARPDVTPSPLDKWARAAIQSALSIVYRMTELHNKQVSSRLQFYFSSTVAFASVFLLRGLRSTLYDVDRGRAMQCLQALDRLISSSPAISITAHLIANVANDLKAALDGWKGNGDGNSATFERNTTGVCMTSDNWAHEAVDQNSQECAIYDFGLDLSGLHNSDFNCVEWDFDS